MAQNKIDWRFTPFSAHGNLMGKIESVDEASDAFFSAGDIAEIVEVATSGNQFDGNAAIIMRLSDGRLAAYDTSYASYAGNDFTDGTGIIFVGHSMMPLLARLSRCGQRLLSKDSKS